MQEGNSTESGDQIILVGGLVPSFTVLLFFTDGPDEPPPHSPKNLKKERPHHKAEKLNKKLSNIKPRRSRPKSFSFKRENYTHGKQYKN